MKRLTLAAIAACVLAIAGCGGHTTTPVSKPVAKATLAPAPLTQSAMGSVAPAGWGGTPPGFVLPPTASSTPTAEMLDGIFVSTFSGLKPFALAGYTAGHWPDYLGLRAAFPQAHAISIAISAVWHADCLDVEPGDAVPSQAGPWALADIKAGFAVPCLYGSLSEMPAIKASLAASLGPNWRSRVMLWVAWYRFIPGLVTGYDAVQWTDHALGRNLDESTVTLRFLQIAQPPYVPPTRLICFPKPSDAVKCAPIIRQVAGYQSAAKASQSAVAGTERAEQRLKRREAMFQQRVQWFSGKASATVKAYS